MGNWKWEEILEDIGLSNKKQEVATTPDVLREEVKYEPKYNGEKVLVFKTEKLKDDSFQGFLIGENAKLLREKILSVDNMFYIDRDIAENDKSYKQVIPYCLINRGDSIFCYQRSKSGSENRLHDLWSLGVGGHVNPCDGFDKETITNACKREIEEEVEFSKLKNAHFVGLINDDSNDVSSVHFGVVYSVNLFDNSSFRVKEESLAEGSFLKKEIVKIEDKNWENWSNLIVEKYLRK